jgi:hypothetical protein
VEIFSFKADFTFESENIDDAFERLAKHFASLSKGELDTELEIIGDINIEPVKQEEK